MTFGQSIHIEDLFMNPRNELLTFLSEAKVFQAVNLAQESQLGTELELATVWVIALQFAKGRP